MRDIRELKQEGLQEREQYLKEQKEILNQKEMKFFKIKNKADKVIEELIGYLVNEMITKSEEEVKKFYREGKSTYSEQRRRGISGWKKGFIKKYVDYFYFYVFKVVFRRVDIEDERKQYYEISPDGKEITLFFINKEYWNKYDEFRKLIGKKINENPDIFFEKSGIPGARSYEMEVRCRLSLGRLEEIN